MLARVGKGGEGNAEGRALSELALGFDDAAHQLRQVLGDGEPKPGPSESCGGFCVGLCVGFEQSFKIRLRDADPGIFDGELDPGASFFFDGPDVQRDASPSGELGGIGEEVEQDLS